MVELVPQDADKMVIIPEDDIPGWNFEIDLIDTAWVICQGQPGGIGFDQEGEYSRHISLDIGAEMYPRRTTCYVRAKFNLDEETRQELDYLAFKARYDDGFVVYLNGERVTDVNAPANPGRRAAATQQHEARDMITFEISQHVDKLVSGENLLAIQGLNLIGNSPDFLIQPVLEARKNYQNNFRSDLPIVKVTLENATHIGPNTVKTASLDITNNSANQQNTLSDPVNDFSGPVNIIQKKNLNEYPKPHYSFTVVNEQGNSQDAQLLGMPAGDEWILYAPYNDKTLLRTALMGHVMAELGHMGAPPQLCHLFINQDYYGIYLLMEKRNRHENRIDISELGFDDLTGDAVTGGYILTLNKHLGNPGFNSDIPPFRGAAYPVRYLYQYPLFENIAPEQQTYIETFMKSFESTIDTDSDYTEIIDVNSFIDYFLVNELAKNVDGYRDLTILYKDRVGVNPKLYIEPVLDFNNTLGNITNYEGNEVQGWQLDILSDASYIGADSMLVPFWWPKLINDVRFTKPLYKRWEALNDDVLSGYSIIDLLDSLYQTVLDDQVLNFERWQITDKAIEPYGYIGETYYDDYDYLYLWLIDRMEWLDSAMQQFQTSIERSGTVSEFKLEQNYPNPFNGSTKISYNLSSETFVDLSVYDVSGRLVATLVKQRQARGSHTVGWNAANFPGGVYIYQIKTTHQIQTKRMVLLR